MSPLKTIAVPLKSAARARLKKSAVPEVLVERDLPAVEQRRAPRATLAQPAHVYGIGERLRMANGGRSLARADSFCRVVSRLPYEGHGALLYRVRSETEQFERVVSEIDLTRQPE